MQPVPQFFLIGNQVAYGIHTLKNFQNIRNRTAGILLQVEERLKKDYVSIRLFGHKLLLLLNVLPDNTS